MVLHYDAKAREYAEELKAIEFNADDERGMFIESYECDVDRALDDRDDANANAKVGQIMETLTRILAEATQ